MIHESIVTDPVTAIKFRQVLETICDQYMDCSGLGYIMFATEADQEQFDLQMQEWEYDNDNEPQLNYSGRNTCLRCNGAGKKEGDPVVYNATIYAF